MTAKNHRSPSGDLKACVVLEIDEAGRAAARWHIAQGKHGAALMPTPQGLFDSWARRPKVRA